MNCRLAFSIASDAPISQAKMVASIAKVEDQVNALAKSSSKLEQHVNNRLESDKPEVQNQSKPGTADLFHTEAETAVSTEEARPCILMKTQP